MSDGEEGYSGPLHDEFLSQSVGRNIDSPVSSSRYSSAGESEFERYCSANSAMGTPSLCSSVGAFHECVDSDFGESTRSFGTVEGEFDLDGFGLGGRFAGKLEDKGRLSNLVSGDLEENVKRSSLHKIMHGATDASVLTGAVDGSSGGLEEEFVDGRKGKEDLGGLLSNVENVLNGGNDTVGTIKHGNMFDDMHNDDGYDERDRTSSRCEHSEGEDSMFNSGSGDENRSNVHYIRHNHQNPEVESKGGNMLLMSSSVAFGSNDWEDFELERIENDSTSQFFDESWQKAESSGAEFGNATFGLANFDGRDKDEGVNVVSLASGEVHDVAESPNYPVGRSVNVVDSFESTERGVVESAREGFVTDKKVNSDDEEIEYLEGCHVYNIFEKPNSLLHVGSINGISDKDDHFDIAEQASGHNGSHVALAKPKDQLCNQEQLGSPSDMMLGQVFGPANDIFEDLAPKNLLIGEPADSSDDHKLNSLSSGPEGNIVLGHVFGPTNDIFEDLAPKNLLIDEPADSSDDYKLNPLSSGPEDNRMRNDLDQTNSKLPPAKDKNVELNAYYDEVVHDMEEILMDSLDSPITRRKQNNVMFHSHQPSPLRDDGSAASASGAFDGNPLTYQHAKIDGIEVVGAKQKKGDISLSERLVGVKEHTVYVIRVWSGEDQWEVEHRYRDFYTLYRRLKSLFSDQGWILPSSWSAVEWESRKFFGNSSPDVVLDRSALIQECLRSVLQFNYPSGLPNALIWFLSPPNDLTSSHQSNSSTEKTPTLGNTVSLIVDLRPHKSVKQLLEEQHYVCAGCHKHLDSGKTRFQEFVQTLGLGKPRLCEYTGQLFCSSCHTNDTAVLPARVLHHWDFTLYPVSQLAKLYLDSIIDQPMLCVSAANPFLMSKVTVLLHVVSIRTKIRALLDYVHCPFRGSIDRGLGSRKYLVESTDFFSLRNLIDLSRGAFAVLPTILETILRKIEEHITEQCLVCCDVGVPCGARQACRDISSLIFPFQDEDEIQRCHTCKLPFHKNCFAKLTECPCGACLKPDVASRSRSSLSLVPSGGGGDGALSLFRMKSDLGLKSSTEFLSKLLTIERRESCAADNQERNNVILMGSLPGNSL